MRKEKGEGRADYLLFAQVVLTVNWIILKLTGVITWSWIWVLCPLWIGIAAWMIIAIIFLFFCIIVMTIGDGIDNI